MTIEPVVTIRKKELYFKVLKGFPINDVRNTTLEVIQEVRKCTKKEAQDIKTLRLEEAEIVKQRILD